jgi:TrwC relaxase
VAKLTVGREEYYTRELATDHEQYLSGPRRVPRTVVRRWRRLAGAAGRSIRGRVPGHVRGPGPHDGELLGRPHGRNAVPTFDVVLWPTKACRFCMAWGMRPPAGRCWPPTTRGWPRRSPTWTSTWGPAAATAVSSTCPDKACWRSASTTGHPGRTDPLLHTHLVIANRVQGPDGRWTAVDGRDVYRHRLAADTIYRATYQRQLARTLGVEWTTADTHGNRELQGAGRPPNGGGSAQHGLSGAPGRPGAASEASGCRSRTGSWRWGIGSSVATTPSPSSGWPTAAAALSPPSTPRPAP